MVVDSLGSTDFSGGRLLRRWRIESNKDGYGMSRGSSSCEKSDGGLNFNCY